MPSRSKSKKNRAILLLSGGLDSLTAGAWAKERRGFELFALTIKYGQRHNAELLAARKTAKFLKVKKHIELTVDLTRIGGSALTDKKIRVPKSRSWSDIAKGIPSTYVPARNTVFLSLALGLAETLSAHHIVIGVNALDYSGYPDCRPEFINTFQQLAQVATKAGSEGTVFKIHTPLIKKTKAQIIRMGTRLGVDYSISHSCYDPRRRSGKSVSCGHCDACLLRLKGFEEARQTDPIAYEKRTKHSR